MTTNPRREHWPALLAVFHDELNRQRVALQAKKSAMDSKSALLIAGAGIVIGLVSSQPSGWTRASAALGIAAAVCGLLAMWPRQGRELSPEASYREWRGLTVDDAEIRMYNHKLEAHRTDRDHLRRSGWLCRWGFLLFVVSVLMATVSLMVR